MSKPEGFYLPEYVFRGTCLGYLGSASSRSVPYTCTTRNPVKAVLFAKHCKLHYYHNPVIYICKTKNLAHLPLLFASRRMDEVEEAITFKLTPTDFYSYCIGYLTLNDMMEIFKSLDISVTASVNLHNLTEKCEQSVVVESNVIEIIVAQMINLMKKS